METRRNLRKNTENSGYVWKCKEMCGNVWNICRDLWRSVDTMNCGVCGDPWRELEIVFNCGQN